MAEDIRAYLEALSADSYPVHEFRLCACPCGSRIFDLESDDNEGTARRVCRECKAEHFICDSGEYWADAEPEKWGCIQCKKKSEGANVGVVFSLYEGGKAIRWLYIGVRCARCGILGSPAGWKIGYEPSLPLLDKV